MRLGEIKSILSKVVDENGNILLKNEPLYGGQAYDIKNYSEILPVLKIVINEKWNDIDTTEIKKIIGNFDVFSVSRQFNQEEFAKLNEYISLLNQKIPLYYKIISSLVEDQPENIINIKLPSEITSLKELSNTNTRLGDILKLFNVDGEFEFREIDKGSIWYVFAGGILSCNFFIACLKVAQEILKLRTEFFKSEKAKIALEIAKKDNDALTKDDFEKRWEDIAIIDGVNNIIKTIGETNGATESELQGKLVKGTNGIIEEIEKGVEFHLSLNPPSYASETNGSLIVDYKKIETIRKQQELEKGKKKEIETQKQDKTDEQK